MIRVIIPTYNSGYYTRACIESLKSQTEDFRAYIVNDASTDNTDAVIKTAINNDGRFDYSINSHNMKSVCNIAAVLNRIDAGTNDIICILDGDDYLINNDALKIISEAYKTTGCEATYGDYVTCDGQVIRTRAIAQVAREIGNYRSDGWYFNPVRTFQYKIWKHIDQNTYLKMGYDFLKDTGDQALFFCVLELIGGNAHYISEPLYKVGAVGRSDGESQEVCRRHIMGLKPNKRVINWDSIPAYKQLKTYRTGRINRRS